MDTPVIHPGHAYVVVIRFVSGCCRVQFTFIKYTSIQVLVFYHGSIHVESVLNILALPILFKFILFSDQLKIEQLLFYNGVIP